MPKAHPMKGSKAMKRKPKAVAKKRPTAKARSMRGRRGYPDSR